MIAALFDLDGTLLDTRALYADSYMHAFSSVLDSPPDFAEMIRRRPASERSFLIDWFGPDLGERVHRAMLDRYRARAPELFAGLFEGVTELLGGLREGGHRLGAVTGKSRGAFEVTDALVALEGFDVVVVEDDVARPKPDPMGIRLALETMGVRPEDALYVGDTSMDVEAARAAGVQVAAALWGRPPEARDKLRGSLRDGEWALGAPADLLERLRYA